MFGSYKLGWWRQPDPLFTFLLLMANATPTGNQVQVMLSAHDMMGLCHFYFPCLMVGVAA